MPTNSLASDIESQCMYRLLHSSVSPHLPRGAAHRRRVGLIHLWIPEAQAAVSVLPTALGSRLSTWPAHDSRALSVQPASADASVATWQTWPPKTSQPSHLSRTSPSLEATGSPAVRQVFSEVCVCRRLSLSHSPRTSLQRETWKQKPLFLFQKDLFPYLASPVN